MPRISLYRNGIVFRCDRKLIRFQVLRQYDGLMFFVGRYGTRISWRRAGVFPNGSRIWSGWEPRRFQLDRLRKGRRAHGLDRLLGSNRVLGDRFDDLAGRLTIKEIEMERTDILVAINQIESKMEKLERSVNLLQAAEAVVDMRAEVYGEMARKDAAALIRAARSMYERAIATPVSWPNIDE